MPWAAGEGQQEDRPAGLSISLSSNVTSPPPASLFLRHPGHGSALEASEEDDFLPSRARFFQKCLPGRMGNDGEQMLGVLCSHGGPDKFGVRMGLGRGQPVETLNPRTEDSWSPHPPSTLGPGCSLVTTPTRKGGETC